ncbi:MAG: hypothetical protein HY225_00960 [Candidatus Vogelbacteria bacterium]|nr:hypothetical protein [Candidatus Vogelbacteria bacterium]
MNNTDKDFRWFYNPLTLALVAGVLSLVSAVMLNFYDSFKVSAPGGMTYYYSSFSGLRLLEPGNLYSTWLGTVCFSPHNKQEGRVNFGTKDHFIPGVGYGAPIEVVFKDGLHAKVCAWADVRISDALLRKYPEGIAANGNPDSVTPLRTVVEKVLQVVANTMTKEDAMEYCGRGFRNKFTQLAWSPGFLKNLNENGVLIDDITAICVK